MARNRKRDASNQEDLSFKLVKLIFTDDKLLKRSISGTCWYGKMDPEKITWIKEFTFALFH